MGVDVEKFHRSMTQLKTFAVMDMREIPLKLLMFFDGFFGTGIMIAFFHCAGASS